MKPHFSDLTTGQRANFGDGCSWVADFHFTASCRHHDFNYYRGGSLKDKLKADWDMCRMMWADSYVAWHYLVTITYWLGLTLLPFPYFFFHWGKYRTLEQIIALDSVL